MSRFLFVSILLILCIVIIVEAARPGKRRGRRWRRKLASAVKWKGNKLKKLKNRVDFPDNIRFDLSIAGIDVQELNLKKNRRMRRARRHRAGKKLRRKNRRRRKEMAFYTGMRGSFACLAEEQSGQTGCEMRGIYSKGKSRCYVKKNQTTCETASEQGYYKVIHLPQHILDQGEKKPRRGRRVRRSVTPSENYRVVEVVALVDKGFMDRFYEDNPGNITAAEEDAEIYATLLLNEVTYFYQSVKEKNRRLPKSGEVLDIFLMLAEFQHPEHGQNFPWSDRYLRTESDGSKTIANGEGALFALNEFISGGNIQGEFDFVMAITGYELASSTAGPSMLGIGFLGTMCVNANYSVSLQEDLSYEASRTATHEMGHSLGAEHDDVSTNGCPTKKHIMSARRFDPTGEAFLQFSDCSLDYFIKHIEKNTDCLASHSFKEAELLDNLCMGGRASDTQLGAGFIEKQCQMSYPHIPNTIPCAGYNPVPKQACSKFNMVKCTDANGQCTGGLKGLWDGTPCFDDNSYCYRGKCESQLTICSEIEPNITLSPGQQPQPQQPQQPQHQFDATTTPAQSPDPPPTEPPTTQSPATTQAQLPAQLVRRKPDPFIGAVQVTTEAAPTPRKKKRPKGKKKRPKKNGAKVKAAKAAKAARKAKRQKKRKNGRKGRKSRDACPDCSKKRNIKGQQRCCKRCRCACCLGCNCQP